MVINIINVMEYLINKKCSYFVHSIVTQTCRTVNIGIIIMMEILTPNIYVHLIQIAKNVNN